MRLAIALLTLGLAVNAEKSCVGISTSRIVGGSLTTISRYPTMAALLRSTTGSIFRQRCGGTIINSWTIITAAHCVRNDAVSRWRFRVGSTAAHKGGRVITVSHIHVHPSYRHPGYSADLALLRGSSHLVFSINVKAAKWAGSNYMLTKGMTVFAAGWGSTRSGSPSVEMLRHVKLQIMDQGKCTRNYAAHKLVVNENMVCAGSAQGGRDQCQGDSGGPLFHNGVLVGISSFGRGCGQASFPGVNTRISAYSTWIRINYFRS